jgi:cell division protein FtsB
MGINYQPLLKGNNKKPWFSKFLFFGFSIITILVVISLFNNFSKLRKAEKKMEERQKYLDELRKENESIKNRLNEITSDRYIEKQLRDNLSMSKEGEIVVVLPEKETLMDLVPRKETKSSVEKSFPNWRKWLSYFNFF